ncbi:TonB-dependent receptor [Flavobacterium sp. DGU38]|uniref:TonB-dependent receptor n=1 Tax=Flavobacterium calami TaxID=3139144 RepID=A0ABU9IQG2_9FLAO
MITKPKLLLFDHLLLSKKEWLIALFMLVFSVNLMSAQGKEISGIVTSTQDQLPLPGVNIIIKGTKTSTTTGFDGQYSIKASPGDVLTFSFIGYQNKQVTVGNDSKINIALGEDTNKLNEVVVVGYGTQKKGDLTGSISVVNVDDAKKTISYDVAKMLQGQAAGVTVQSSGEPGGFVNIKIRGISSFKNNNPLFIIDGILVDDPYDFAPGDIESMQILKDASAASIYGVRGANGVIIITTKKGKTGKMNVGFKTLYGIQNVAKKWSLTNREQYQKITSEAEKNLGITIAPGNDPTSSSYINNVDTDWQDAAFKTGTIQNSALNVNGGSENMGYSMNVDYFKNTGYIATPQDYERISTDLNLNGKKGIFSYGTKIAYTQANKESFNEYNAGQTAISDLLGAIPTMPVYDSNRLGGYGGTDNATQRAISMNVIGFNNLIENTNKRNHILGNLWFQVELLKGLKYKLAGSYDRLDSQNRRYVPQSDLGWYYVTEAAEASLDVSNSNMTKTILDNLLTYDLTLGSHKIDALLGYIQQKNDFYNHWSRGKGYPTGTIAEIQYAQEVNGISAGEYYSKETTKSYVSRLNYSYNDLYFITGNFRQDKSSKFAPENNTGNFYGISGAWKLSNEKFLHLPAWFNTIKLRGGYGELGNNTIGLYAYASTLNSFASYNFNGTLANGTTSVRTTDPDISWETTATTNFAVDLGFFDNKLQLTAEYYIKKSNDLLINFPIPYSTGSISYADNGFANPDVETNAASIENKGLEFTASYRNNNHAFKYGISGNISFLKNKVLGLGKSNLPIYGAASKTEVGRSVGEIYGYETAGIFQTAGEIASSPTQTNAGVGDIKFKDQLTVDTDGDGKFDAGDGIINDKDRVYQGVTIPKYNFGFNFDAQYKNWDMSFMFQGAGGNKVFNGMYRNLMAGDYGNHHTDELNYWTPTNTNTNVPRPIIGDPNGNRRDSNRFIEDGDYIRMQNFEIGYSVPLANSKVIQKIRIYANGQNLFTITNYKGYDPDFNSNDGLLSRGYDGGSFPNPRTISLGVQANF